MRNLKKIHGILWRSLCLRGKLKGSPEPPYKVPHCLNGIFFRSRNIQIQFRQLTDEFTRFLKNKTLKQPPGLFGTGTIRLKPDLFNSNPTYSAESRRVLQSSSAYKLVQAITTLGMTFWFTAQPQMENMINTLNAAFAMIHGWDGVSLFLARHESAVTFVSPNLLISPYISPNPLITHL